MPVTLTSTGITFSDNTTQSTAASASGPGDIAFRGAGTITVPQGANRMIVSGIGGGGGQHCGYGSGAHGSGGASCMFSVINVTSGETMTLTTGTGGSGANWGGWSSAGNATTFVGSSSGTVLTLGGGGGSKFGTEGAGGSISGTITGDYKNGNQSGAGTAPSDNGINWFGYTKGGVYTRGGQFQNGSTGASGFMAVHGFYTA